MELPNLRLEIHHIDVRGGEATAIVVRDLDKNTIVYRALIDAGAEGSGSDRLAAYIKQYIDLDANAETVGAFDLIIASHYHNDHIDGFRKSPIPFKQFIDVGGYTITGTENVQPINNTGANFSATYISAYKRHIQAQNAKRIKIPFIEKGFTANADPVPIQLGSTGITLMCYAGNGIVANGKPGGRNVLVEQKSQGKQIDPNDNSFAFVLQWEDFTYFTAGDLSGDTKFDSYYNIEQPLVEVLTGEGGPFKNRALDVLKVNHHGSEHSSYEGATISESFLGMLKPETLIIPCNQSKQVPHDLFLKRLVAYAETSDQITVSFVNDLYYRTSNPRNEPLASIVNRKQTKANLRIDDADNNSVINDDTLAVIVVRNSRGFSDDAMAEEKDTIIQKKGYKVIIRRGTLKGIKRGIGRASDFKPFGFFEATYASVMSGFVEQVQAIVDWKAQDNRDGATVGLDYVTKFFPALKEAYEATAAEGLAAVLLPKMQEMLDKRFVLSTMVNRQLGTETKVYQPRSNFDLTPDEEETIYWLLIYNPHQGLYNREIGISDLRNEPYGTSQPKRSEQFVRKGDRTKRPKLIQ